MSVATASDLEFAPAPCRPPLVIPLLLAAAFVALAGWLFYGWDPNPLIEYRLMQIDPYVLFDHFRLSRTLFWVLIVCMIWPLIGRRIKARPIRQSEPRVAAAVPSALTLCSACRRCRVR